MPIKPTSIPHEERPSSSSNSRSSSYFYLSIPDQRSHQEFKMQFQKTFTTVAALLSVASAYINSNQLNLWTDSACSVPDKEITLTATGCACNNIASPGALSVSAAVTDANCTPEIYGYTSTNCGGGAVLVASEDLTTCVTDGNHAFLSFMVVTPCFTN